jgi:hypothetical protein
LQVIDLFNQFLPEDYQLTTENPGRDVIVGSPFAYTTVFAMNGAPYNYFNAARGWTSTRATDGRGIRGTISFGGGPVSIYGSISAHDPFSTTQNPGYLNEKGVWLWQTVSIPGDFNADQRVEGLDLLVWQRNPAVGDLADWQANYGNQSAAMATIPEPATAICAGIAAAFVFLRRHHPLAGSPRGPGDC